MVCPSCGTENAGTAKFCNECGAQLEWTCASCGSGNAPTARFCNECGGALGEEAAIGTRSTSGASTPVAERRLVSVLFVDLVGFTTASEARDAEDTRELLTRYFDVARTTITRYGGTVEKFIGDAVMAVWGAPVPSVANRGRRVVVRPRQELISSVF
jgi:class 3 adenylate cyclase